jgi:hypothetical protein
MDPAGHHSGAEVEPARALFDLRVVADGISRAEPAIEFAAAGTKPMPRRFADKCSNLARGESTKAPSRSSDVGGVFVCRLGGRHCELCDPADLTIELRGTNTIRSVFHYRKVHHACVDGNSDQFDRLCRLHRHRDLSQIAGRKIAGPLSAF